MAERMGVVKMSEEGGPGWGGDYWSETLQKRRAWIAEIICNSTLEIDSAESLTVICDKLDNWITNGTAVPTSAAGGNISQLTRR